jgi:hypothetical protein
MANTKVETVTVGGEGPKRPGRNDPCPCGSGKKYKKCCLAKDEAQAMKAARAEEAETARLAQAGWTANGGASGGEVEKYGAGDGRELEEPLDESAGADGGPTERAGLAPASENEKKVASLIWEFERREHPTADHLNAYLDELLGLAPKDMEWSRVLESVEERLPSELPNAFRRLAARLPRTKEAGVAFLCWTAVEQFERHSCHAQMPEVVDELLKLDGGNYDADALHHIECHLLADGLDGEVLRLVGHFLPIMRQDRELMAYAVPEVALLLFEIRAGRLLLGDLDPGLTPEEAASRLREGVSEDVDLEVANYLAAIALEKGPRPPLGREDFGLVTGATDGARTREGDFRPCGGLLRVAEEGYREEGVAPGCAFPALMRLAAAAHDWLEGRKRKKNSEGNLLDFLDPVGLEARIARSSQGMLSTDPPKARLLVQAHRLLLHSAMRHKLIAADKAAGAEAELDRLGAALGEKGVPEAGGELPAAG